MEIIEAAAAGMCFGVRDALEAAEAVENPQNVVIHGELVHNSLVNRRLAARGFAVTGETREPANVVPLTIRGAAPTASPERGIVLITAHGVSDAERQRLTAQGKRIIDTTCPLVRRAHAAAVGLATRGYHVLVIGKANHVEVRGLTGDLTSVDVLGSADDVRPYPYPKLGVVCQTTCGESDVRRTLDAIHRANPAAEIRFIDTVCRPTKDRQRALIELLARVDLVVVVGGRHSNNTRKLVETCHAAAVQAVHVENAAELRVADFLGIRRVGLTAGTSTLEETLAAVRQCLMEISRQVKAVRAVA